MNPQIPTTQNIVYSTPVYFSIGYGLNNSKCGVLSFNNQNLMLGLEDGHVVFDEPLANIKKVEFYNSMMRVFMPTGAATILFTNPNDYKQDLIASAAVSYVGQSIPSTGAHVGGAAAATNYAQNAQDKIISNSDIGEGWQQILQGKVKVSGSSKRDLANTITGAAKGMSLLVAIASVIFLLGSIPMIFTPENKTVGIISTAILVPLLVISIIVWKKTLTEKTSFPSSR